MKKLLLLATSAMLCSHWANAQFSEFEQDSTFSSFTLGSNSNTLQIGGRISGYYENRDLKSGVTNLSHNGFAMKDGDLDILGKTSSKFIYEFHLSVLDLASAAATQNTADPAAPGIKAAYVAYEGLKVHIKFGFDKLPYSLSSIAPEHLTPMWSHSNLIGGDLFSRRDFGLTLNTRLLQNHLTLYAGAYSGMGENFFEYGNDASGTFQYVGRAEYSFTGKMKYRLVDEDVSVKPQFRIAINGRYEDKTQPAGQTIGVDAPGMYGTRIIDGKQSVIGGDFIFLYKGFSAAFEVHRLQLTPKDSTNSLFDGSSSKVNKGVINGGGFLTMVSYNYPKLNSVLTVSFENVNANDLVPGDQQWFSIGYAYLINGFNSCFKAEFYKPTLEDVNSNPLKYNSQFRIGYQLVF